MKLKNGLLVASLLLIGAVFAQETPPEPPVPVELSPHPGPPPVIEEEVTPPPPPAPGPKYTVKSDIIDFPDVEAEFPGGTAGMKKFIQENFNYPEKARENGDQGRVYVTFIVEPDGSISNIDLMRGGLTPELNAEAKRIVRMMPPWKPGEVKGQAVRCRCRLPITFVLTGPDKK